MTERKPAHPELASVHVDGGSGNLSRTDAILKAALAVGALYGLGAIGPYVRKALALVGESDVDTLNFLLPFEYLQLGIYERGLSELNDHEQPMKLSDERRVLLETLAGEEGQHVEALTAMIKKLGGKPVGKGSYAYAFPGLYEFFRLAANLEESAIDAYNGVIPMLESSEARMLAGSIVQVEGRHAAVVRIERHDEPAPEAFDRARTPYEALNSVEKYTGPAIFEQS